jgi:riboflavin transporter FmnP
MLFEFPIPFIAPSFYQLDLSEIVVLIGGFAMGPMAAVIIEGIKIILNFALNGTITAGVGELANFAIGCAFVVPAALIYRRHKSRGSAMVGLAAGTLSLTVVGVLLNIMCCCLLTATSWVSIRRSL